VLINGSQVDSFPNCYFFQDGGFWYEAAFPVQGAWTQDSTGAKTSYRVDGTGPFTGFLQVGLVTPASGGGVLQIDTVSTTPALPGFSFYAVGAEIDASEVASLCPPPAS
jgi:hypothetical protein